MEFIKGKWYKFLWTVNNQIIYGKINNVSINSFDVIEGIHNNNYDTINGYFINMCENLELLTDLSEIQQWLPDGHEDKIKTIESKFEIGDIIDTDTNGYQYTSMDLWSKDEHPDWEHIKNCNCRTASKKSLKILNKVYSIYTNSWWYNVEQYANWISEDCMSKHEEESKSLVGRWVKRISKIHYDLDYGVPIGDYDIITLNEDENNGLYILEKFTTCDKRYLLDEFELMPEGFNPDSVPPKVVSKELTIDDLVEGEIYTCTDSDGYKIVFKYKNKRNLNKINCYYYVSHNQKLVINDWCKPFNRNNKSTVKLSDNLELKWLNVCIKQDKFISQDQLDLYDDVTFELKTVMKKDIYETIVLKSEEELLACEKYFNNLGYRATRSHNSYSNKHTNFIIYHNSKEYQNLTSSPHPKVTLEKFGITVNKKEEPKYDYEVVHCTTQEELDYASKVLKSTSTRTAPYCVHIKCGSFDTLDVCQDKYKIYSFQEFCTKFNHNPEFMNKKEEEYQVGDWVTIKDSDNLEIGCQGCPKGTFIVVENVLESKIAGLSCSNENTFIIKTDVNHFNFWRISNIGVRKALPNEIPTQQEEFVLPEKWCVQDSALVSEWASKIFHCGNQYNTKTKLCIQQKYFPESKCYQFLVGVNDYTEITFEQFKKYVLKENDSKSVENNQIPEYVECIEKSNSNYIGVVGNIYKVINWNHSDLDCKLEGEVSGVKKSRFKPSSKDAYDAQQKRLSNDTIQPKEMSKEELIEEAKRRFPVGTKYKCAESGAEYILNINKNTYHVYDSDNIDAGDNMGYLYYYGKWAEIISYGNLAATLPEDYVSIAKQTGYVICTDEAPKTNKQNKIESKLSQVKTIKTFLNNN